LSHLINEPLFSIGITLIFSHSFFYYLVFIFPKNRSNIRVSIWTLQILSYNGLTKLSNEEIKMQQQKVIEEKKLLKPRPVLKWAGGKQQMLNVIVPNLPDEFNKYIEPFIGGGALFFELSPENAIISDTNPELINMYKIIAEDVDGLIEKLEVMKNEENFYYMVRAINPETLTNVEKAARTIYLNRTCFNGLYRVNKKGEFNVPYGKYKNPKICDKENLKAASRILKNTTIIHADYKDVLRTYAEQGDFIFLDPPYLPISKFSDFKRYTKEQFHIKDQEELAEEVKRLRDIGCNALLTNSNHPLVHELYKEFEIDVFQTRRNINSNASKRTGEDVLVHIKPIINFRDKVEYSIANADSETPLGINLQEIELNNGVLEEKVNEQINSDVTGDIQLLELNESNNSLNIKSNAEGGHLDFKVVAKSVEISEQMKKFPSTRFMGSKEKLLSHILGVASQFKYESVLDLFSGSGVVSYLFKTEGKQVFSNDYMSFSANFTKALVENSCTTLNDIDLEIILDEETKTDNFVFETFKDLYFFDEDNAFIDMVRANLNRLEDVTKQSLVLAALVRACLKKRPRGIFTYTGHRYNDGRRDLILSLKEQFLEAVESINEAVFDNGKNNISNHGNALEIEQIADLVYIDPPYYSPLSDNEYVRRYHFVEGLVKDWKDVEMQWHTKTKKFKSYSTPFSSQKGAYEAFDIIFEKHRHSILIVSYSSNSLPAKDDMVAIMSKYKKNVDVVSVNHKYSFGNQGHKVGNNKNNVEEYLFIGY
jgi:DNA adenine methylase Dam